ncbi:hypothetical protein M408DRAFT_300649 [Serendipita vermifera MAFF 305830]|uniref:Uncharacterized protein n=1 Tax=Serendipita vermifera MAFF 305830 TaxID=933852 RepID=A0A0C3ARA9_SERVB|nr:hypothetical protein M408DRAFT_300649 [Serendipita vermifera MAFF 305830]
MPRMFLPLRCHISNHPYRLVMAFKIFKAERDRLQGSSEPYNIGGSCARSSAEDPYYRNRVEFPFNGYLNSNYGADLKTQEADQRKFYLANSSSKGLTRLFS